MIRSSVLVSSLFLAGWFAAPASDPKPMKTVDKVDLNRYAGKWYEIARMPNRFEKKCDSDVTAEYSLDGSMVKVRNSCVKADGTATVANGKAKVVDTATNAKLKVTFFWPFYGDYWIIGVDRDYRWAVVGEPGRKYLWVLSRTPVLAREDSERIDRVIAEQGYQRSELVRTEQRVR